MSRKGKKADKDYRGRIRARAEKTQRLRRKILEKADKTEKRGGGAARSLRQKVKRAPAK